MRCEPGLEGPVRAGLAEEKKKLREKAHLVRLLLSDWNGAGLREKRWDCELIVDVLGLCTHKSIEDSRMVNPFNLLMRSNIQARVFCF